MLERFLQILEYSFETYQDSLVLNSAQFQNVNLTLEATLHFEDEEDNYIEKYGVWRVFCSKVREQKICFGDCYSYDFVSRDADDILKWKYTKPYYSISFRGKPNNSLEMIGGLYETHTKLVKDQIPFKNFFNRFSSLEELISGGFGLLAEGVPEPLAIAYKSTLESFNVAANLSKPYRRSYWNGEIITDNQVPVCLLILGESVIIAENFEAEEISSKKV